MPTEWYKQDTPASLKGKRVLVLDGAFYGSIVSMFAAFGFERAADVISADLVCFTGGVDVDPRLYGQKALPVTQSPNKTRDDYETKIYHDCVKMGIPMVGICRGAQFLHVMNGGKLWQHVSGHTGADHIIYDIDDDVNVLSTSIHHQMLQKNEGLEVVAITPHVVSRVFMDDKTTIKLPSSGDVEEDLTEVEIEAGAYPKTKCFFTQGHPEVGGWLYKTWFFHKIAEHLFPAGVE